MPSRTWVPLVSLIPKLINLDKAMIDLSRSNELMKKDISLTYDDIDDFKNEHKRESIPAQHKRSEVLASSYIKKANSSWGMRKGESKSEAIKLYNRGDNFLNTKENMIASRNNAYNSLVDWYRMPSAGEQKTFENVLPNSQDMNRVASTSFNVVNVSDLNADLL